MQVTIYGPNLPDDLSRLGTLVVHATDCADTRRGPYPRLGPDQGGWTIEATTKAEVVEDVYPPDEFGYDPADPAPAAAYASDVHFFPCTGELE